MTYIPQLIESFCCVTIPTLILDVMKTN